MRLRLALWLAIACLLATLPLSLLAFKSLWSAAGLTIDRYLSQWLDDRINYSYFDDVPEGVLPVNKRPFSATVLQRLRKLVRPTQELRSRKVVLFWTSWFRRAWWGHLRGGLDLEAAGCPETRCHFTHDRSLLQEATIVLFQAEGVRVEDLPSGRRPGDQRWVWVHVEAPPASSRAFSKLQRLQTGDPRRLHQDLSPLFNWTMTYHPNSELMEPYGALLPVALEAPTRATEPLGPASSTRGGGDTHSLRPALLDHQNSAYKAYLEALVQGSSLEEVVGRSWVSFVDSDAEGMEDAWRRILTRPRLVAWMSSKCHTPSRREDYVAELQHHVAVDVYGKCGNLRCGARVKHRDDSCWRQVLAPKYLFYLAFENAACDSYITEKVWRPLIHGVVPIVLGGANYSNFLPPNSYIDALKFTPRELAEVMMQLQASPDDYARYHLWRGFWRPTLRTPLCELCFRAHEDTEETTQVDISGWWRTVGHCRDPMAGRDIA
nr:alpha-(1,3)-fucosyltransferase C-like [Procambarus clarkii]